jgi:hypothetical protein
MALHAPFWQAMPSPQQVPLQAGRPSGQAQAPSTQVAPGRQQVVPHASG